MNSAAPIRTRELYRSGLITHQERPGEILMLNLHRSLMHEEVRPESALTRWLQDKKVANDEVIKGLRERENLHHARELRAKDDSRKPLVIVVDDEPIIAVTLSELLNRHGCVSVWFTSPLLAIEFATQKSVDLLLSDLQMPGLTGDQLYTRFAALQPHTPVLFLSASTEKLESVARQFSWNPLLFFAGKPIRVDRLVSLVRGMLQAETDPESRTPQKSVSNSNLTDVA